MSEKSAETKRAEVGASDSARPEPALPREVDASPEAWINVWSRSGSKYRVRAILLLAVNVLLFAGVGTFAYWLRSGEFFAPARAGYAGDLWRTLSGVGQADVSLGSLLIGPINAQDVPMLIPILGLLMAALVSIPILVAILYRFWSSLPFIAVVGCLAVMPWLALTLLGSCILASARPFRTRFRFMSALIGLVPVIVYLALAWNGTREVMVGRIDPVDAFKFVAPWILAVVASSVVFAIVLTIARLVNYRPGAVTPLLAVMFALPVALFEFHVGRDELYYRLLEDLESRHFVDVDATVHFDIAAKRIYAELRPPRPPFQSIKDRAEQQWMLELTSDLGPYNTDLARHQAEIAHRCDSFHKYFPTSRYLPNVLYIKARALDRRVDLLEFRRTKWVRFYDDFPSRASRDTWRLILENRPDSPLGALAGLRLAQLEAREGETTRAVRILRTTLEKFDDPKELRSELDSEASEPPAPKPWATTIFAAALATRSPESSLRIPVDQIVLQAQRLFGLLAQNNDPLYGYDPLCGPKRGSAGQKRSEPAAPVWFGMLDLDPRGDYYVEQLERLKAAYPNSQVEDNIDLEIAKSAASLDARIVRLEALVSRFPWRDAAPEALLYLALAYESAGREQDSMAALSRLAQEHPKSYWTRAARIAGLRSYAELQVSGADYAARHSRFPGNRAQPE